MSQIQCTLCEISVTAEGIDLQQSLTVHSKIPLLEFLQNSVGETLITTNYTICKNCYIQLNELDQIKMREEFLHKQFKNYVTNCNTKDFLLESKFEEPILKNELVHDPKFEIVKFEVNYSDDVETKTKGRKRKEPGMFKCTECSKICKCQTELKNHMISHSKEKPFICHICGQAYKRKGSLVIHVGMHNGINPFSCIYCKKTFTQKGTLKRHMPIHTGERPFQCHICGKRFAHHTSFNIHKLSHSGEKSYKCDICEMALLSISHLKRHKKIHTGERNYSCTFCGRRFAEKYNLVSHEKLHLRENNKTSSTQKRRYRCQLCDDAFDRKIRLDEHLIEHHQKMLESEEPLIGL